MNVDQLIATMTPAIYKNMKDALELGRWGDGRSVSGEQKSNCLEAMIRYEDLHDIPEADRIGYVDMTNKRKKAAEAQPIKIIEN